MQIYPNYYKARLIQRINRFVMLLDFKGKIIKAYIPNTGRMEEFLNEGQIFYFTKIKMKTMDYKVVATEYQESLVFLDTVRVNDIFDYILKSRKINEFANFHTLQREISFGKSRFDFILDKNSDQQKIIEVKSCTLVHNNLAMFPDAPTLRGIKHIKHLEKITSDNYVVFLVLNKNAEKFIPNYHTDFKYGEIFLNSDNVKFRAYKISFLDPVTFDLNSLLPVDIDYSKLKNNCQNKGSYLIILENRENFNMNIGSLGNRSFKKGFYIYVGSGMGNLEKRVKRHFLKRKKTYYHIDYISPGKMKPGKVYYFRTKLRIESKLAKKLEIIGDGVVDGFGSSDTNASSHLIFFKENPVRKKEFIQLVLNFRSDF